MVQDVCEVGYHRSLDVFDTRYEMEDGLMRLAET